MKLQNKKTGEIVDLIEIVRINDVSKEFFLRLSDNEGRTFKVGFNSLAELNEEWEDYEESKEWYWYIEDNGIIQRSCHYEDLHPTLDKARKEIGNYFSSREDAVKAVEKLKAWKRLKDKGLRFERWGIGGEYGNTITFSDYIEYNDETRADLDLLFGGEE